jgi:uncharacterized protein YndB with AHSA1/START domain
MTDGGDPGTGSVEEVLVTRVFDAPRELVFAAWTESQHLKRWWGPAGYTMPYCEIHLREGGVFFYCMRSPEGRDIWVKGDFREVVVPERLILTVSFTDAEGNVVAPTRYGMSSDWPMEMLMKVTFDEGEGKTKVTLRYEGVPPGADRDESRQGWAESLDRLAEYLAKA